MRVPPTGQVIGALIFALGMVLCFLPPPARAASDAPFFFIQGSDPQFGWCASSHDLPAGFAQDTANFEFVIATANRLHPAFLIVTGDLVDEPGNAAEIAEYFRVAGKLDPSIHLYNVPGNHDVDNSPTPARLAAYREKFGPDYFTFRVGRMAAFVVDSSILVDPKNVPDEFAKQEKWLRRELAKAKQDGVQYLVVFEHHPPFVVSAGEKDSYYNIPLARRGNYLRLLREYGVSYVFSGHYHRNATASYGLLKLATTTAISCADTQSGIRVITVGNAGITTGAYDFGVLPARIDLTGEKPN